MKKWRFCKLLEFRGFRFLYIFSICKSYAFRLSELCFGPLTCGKWGAQMPQMTRSKATNGNLKDGKWRFNVMKMEVRALVFHFSSSIFVWNRMVSLAKIVVIFHKNKRPFSIFFFRENGFCGLFMRESFCLSNPLWQGKRALVGNVEVFIKLCERMWFVQLKISIFATNYV